MFVYSCILESLFLWTMIRKRTWIHQKYNWCWSIYGNGFLKICYAAFKTFSLIVSTLFETKIQRTVVIISSSNFVFSIDIRKTHTRPEILEKIHTGAQRIFYRLTRNDRDNYKHSYQKISHAFPVGWYSYLWTWSIYWKRWNVISENWKLSASTKQSLSG